MPRTSSNNAQDHAQTRDLAFFIRGKLRADNADWICAHVVVCPQCREHYQELSELLRPGLSLWIRCWLRIFSSSWPPWKVFYMIQSTFRRATPLTKDI
jgi:hypothetical protein